MWGHFSIREKILLLLLVFLLLGGVLWKIGPALSTLLVSGRSPGGLVEENSSFQPEEDSQSKAEPEMITVHLIGAVQNPGIYQLPVGSRVYELLEAGGGPVEEADLEAVNLARPLYDGEQIAICRCGETAANSSSTEQKININKASQEDLQTLPSIGEVRAQRIIAHREKYGPFGDISEIMDVSGIGPGIYNQISDLITIY